jgi:hypothetical protein
VTAKQGETLRYEFPRYGDVISATGTAWPRQILVPKTARLTEGAAIDLDGTQWRIRYLECMHDGPRAWLEDMPPWGSRRRAKPAVPYHVIFSTENDFSC